jgi:hypothetical protein
MRQWEVRFQLTVPIVLFIRPLRPIIYTSHTSLCNSPNPARRSAASLHSRMFHFVLLVSFVQALRWSQQPVFDR